MSAFFRLVRETWREGREHPTLWGAAFMVPLGFRWDSDTHRWVRRA